MKTDEKHARQMEGLRRHCLIAPLTYEGIPDFEKKRLRLQIMEEANISARTLRRWLLNYREGGFDAIVPKPRKDKGCCRAISEEALALAEECRTELPRRSAGLIARLLDGFGHKVARSTLERHLRQRGLSGRELRMAAKTTMSRRFVRIGRNTLWQADIKYGPYIPDPAQPGKNIRTYLLVLLDDATRVVVFAGFYDNQKQPILEDGLKKAILRYGSPKELYVDNGKIFVSHWLKLACARLNIKHITAKPYSPESKGKIERFNRTVENFIGETGLIGVKSLEELNELFRIWLHEAYQHNGHASLGGISPATAFANDSAPLRFHSPETLQECFLWEETRKVDKSGCFSLSGKTFEAGVEFIRKKVDLRFDPFNSVEVQLWYQGKRIKDVQQLSTVEYNCILKPEPEVLKIPGKSRALDAFAKQNANRYKQKLGAYRLSKEGADNV